MNVQHFIGFTRLNRAEVVASVVLGKISLLHRSRAGGGRRLVISLPSFAGTNVSPRLRPPTSGGDFERGNAETKKRAFEKERREKQTAGGTVGSIVKKVLKKS